MRTFVVDASVAAKWLIDEEGTEAALGLREPANDLVAPDLLFLEVGSVVWRKVRSGEVAESDGRAMVVAVLDAPLFVERSTALLPSAWEIAIRYGCSVYDGIYLALAVALGVPLVTADRKLGHALRGTLLERTVVGLPDVSRQ